MVNIYKLGNILDDLTTRLNIEGEEIPFFTTLQEVNNVLEDDLDEKITFNDIKNNFSNYNYFKVNLDTSEYKINDEVIAKKGCTEDTIKQYYKDIEELDVLVNAEEVVEESLTEGIADVKKYYSDINDDDFSKIIKADPTFKDDVDKVGTYGKWLLNLYKKKKLKLEDLYKATEYLTEFERKKKLFKNKDIGQFKSLPDLFDALKQTEEPELSDNQKQKQFHKEINKSDLNADVVLDTLNWTVYVPKDYAASCKLSKNTEWCTGISSKGDDYYYNYYTEDGPLYILHNKHDENEKYQFHFESGQFMDSSDREIDLILFLDSHGELKEFFTNILLSRYYKNLKIDENTPDDAEVTYVFSHFYLISALEEIRTRNEVGGRFAASILDGDDDEFYTYFDDKISTTDIFNYYVDTIDKYAFSTLEELGCTAIDSQEFIDKAQKGKLDEILPEDIVEDVEWAALKSYNEAFAAGSADACRRDIYAALSDVFEHLDAKYEDDDLVIKGTKEQWEKTLKDYLFSYYAYADSSEDLDDVLSHIIEENFKLFEPRYGWQDFDKDAFNECFYDTLDEILWRSKESKNKEKQENLKNIKYL